MFEKLLISQYPFLSDVGSLELNLMARFQVANGFAGRHLPFDPLTERVELAHAGNSGFVTRFVGLRTRLPSAPPVANRQYKILIYIIN
jgi:hypothetical protein